MTIFGILFFKTQYAVKKSHIFRHFIVYGDIHNLCKQLNDTCEYTVIMPNMPLL
jgi:hypothetical protein